MNKQYPQRTIKFRAWDYNYQKMLSWEELLLSNDRWSLFAALGGENYTTTSEQMYFLHPMQWTGLKDVNNIDIYECDIVEYHPYGQKYKPIDTSLGVLKLWLKYGTLNTNKIRDSQREVSEYQEQYYVNYYSGAFRLDATFGGYGGMQLSKQLKTIECKIVGNKFQNPELVKKIPEPPQVN